MGKIIAIGGGELKDLETLLIDKEIVRLTGKKNPRALFIPTASGDPEGYWKTFQDVYGKRLGCRTDVLFLIRECPSKAEIERKVLSADLIYVGGGNTLKMMKRWRATGLDKLLRKAYERGVVLSGLSAGAICWFRYCCSDSNKDWKRKPKSNYLRVKGLGLINATASPHLICEPERVKGFKIMMQRTPGTGIALDDYCAIEVIDDRYRIITSKPSSAYNVYNKDKKIILEKIPEYKEFRPINELLN